MKIVTKNYVYKPIKELTPDEMKRFIVFISKNDSLIEIFSEDIRDDVETECKNRLRENSYTFQCDDILYDDNDNPELFYKLRYIGEMPKDAIISDRYSIKVEYIKYEDKTSYDCDITDGVIFRMYSNLNDNDLVYKETFDAWYINELKNEFIRDYHNNDQEYANVLKYTSEVISRITKEYALFKTDVDKLATWFKNLVQLSGPEFEKYILRYSDIGIYFNDDENIIDYDWNYND